MVPLYQTTKLSKLKANADDKILINVIEKFKPDFRGVENIVGKRENVGYQHFLLFPTMFSEGVFFWVVKTRNC